MKLIGLTNQVFYTVPQSMKNFQACAGLLIKGEKTIAIDTNMGPDQTLAFLVEHKPDMAIITHYHIDHSTWAKTVDEIETIELFVPESEGHLLTSIEKFVDHTAGPYGLHAEWKDFTVNTAKFKPISRFSTYDWNRFPEIKKPLVKPIFTPGHSPGHFAFYLPEDGILFTGDMGVDRFGPWYGWGDCDLKNLMESIIKLREIPARILATSHGGIVSENIERAWDRAIEILIKRESFVARKLELGAGKDEIVREGIFFPQKERVSEPMKSFLYMWDSFMFDHHKKLLEEGGFRAYFPEVVKKFFQSLNAENKA